VRSLETEVPPSHIVDYMNKGPERYEKSNPLSQALTHSLSRRTKYCMLLTARRLVSMDTDVREDGTFQVKASKYFILDVDGDKQRL